MQLLFTPAAQHFTDNRGAVFPGGLTVAIEHTQLAGEKLEANFGFAVCCWHVSGFQIKNTTTRPSSETAATGDGFINGLCGRIQARRETVLVGFTGGGKHWSAFVNDADCVFERKMEFLPAIRRYITDQLFLLWVDVEFPNLCKTEVVQLQARAWGENVLWGLHLCCYLISNQNQRAITNQSLRPFNIALANLLHEAVVADVPNFVSDGCCHSSHRLLFDLRRFADARQHTKHLIGHSMTQLFRPHVNGMNARVAHCFSGLFWRPAEEVDCLLLFHMQHCKLIYQLGQ